MILRSIILLTITVIFAISSYTGLKKGIQKLSDVNVWLSFLLLAFVFIVGPTVFIMETTVTGFGNMIKDFFHMATWMEPFGGIKVVKKRISPRLDNILLVMVARLCTVYWIVYRAYLKRTYT